MADKTTYIKLDRNLRYWRWFKNPKTLTVWLWLLLSANIEDHDFESDTIHRGEIATSRKTIMTATGLTEDEVRTALKHLNHTGEITVRRRPKYQVITIVEFDKYQNFPGNFPVKSPADPRQVPVKSPQSKNDKNERMKRKKKDIFSAPTAAEVLEYASQEGITMTPHDADQFIWYNESRKWEGVKDWKPLLKYRADQAGWNATSTEENENERRED